MHSLLKVIAALMTDNYLLLIIIKPVFIEFLGSGSPPEAANEAACEA